MAGILDILNVVGTVVDRVIPDPKDKLELQQKLAELADAEATRQHDELMGQIDVNKIEAANPRMFVAGWRPFIGWSCGVGFIYSTMLAPAFHLGMPDLGFLRDILLGMLGLTGTMRTIEKLKGVDTATATRNVAEAGQPAAPLAPRRKKFLGLF
jgi:hypothetical protein